MEFVEFEDFDGVAGGAVRCHDDFVLADADGDARHVQGMRHEQPYAEVGLLYLALRHVGADTREQVQQDVVRLHGLLGLLRRDGAQDDADDGAGDPGGLLVGHVLLEFLVDGHHLLGTDSRGAVQRNLEVVHLVGELLYLGQREAHVERFAGACAGNGRGDQRERLPFACLAVLVVEVHHAAAHERARHVELAQDGAVARVPDDDDFLAAFADGGGLGGHRGNLRAERHEVVLAVGAAQALGHELQHLAGHLELAFLVGLDRVDVRDCRFVGRAVELVDHGGEVAQQTVVVDLLLVFLVKGVHRYLGAANFHHRAVDVHHGEVVQDLVLVHEQQFEGPCPVGARVVVGDDGRGLVRDGLGVEILVDLLRLREVLRAFLEVALVVVEAAEVEVVEELAVRPVEVVLLLLHLLDGRVDALLLEGFAELLVARHGLVGAASKD